MPDGNVPFSTSDAGWRRPLPQDSAKLAKGFWATKPPGIPTAPIETTRNGVVTCHDAAPDSPLMHDGAGVEHTIGEYTLRACGIRRETEYPTLGGDELDWLSVRDPSERERQKERMRKRVRSRILRDGVAPVLDPSAFRPEHRWAVERVNRAAIMRFTEPLCDPSRRTAWANDPDPILRHVDLWIFRTIARRSGRNKLGPATIVGRLSALRDVPTLTGKGRVSDLDCDSDKAALAERLSCVTRALETFGRRKST